jgi:hypothetical protein
LAAAGEILVTVEAATAAALDLGSLDRQRLELRGKHQTIDVVRLRVGLPTRSPTKVSLQTVCSAAE